MAKATFQDIARAAGVGTATVERVLNGRGGVRPNKVERVLAAARALDYPRRLPEAHRGLLRIEVLLVRPETTFFLRLSKSFERIAATLDSTVAVHRTFMDEGDPAATAAHILSPTFRRAGLIAAVPDHPLIRQALLRLQAEGCPVLQVVTKASGLAVDYVGIDNYSAGRTAAMFMSRMQSRPGAVAVLCHSGIFEAHRERVRGFSDYMATRASHLDFGRVLMTQDDMQRATSLLSETLNACPNLVGLYNAGGANATLSDVLRQHPRGQDIFFVGHELTERSARALREGVMDIVLDQAPEAQARRAMDLILQMLGLQTAIVENPPIRFVIVTAENI